jgi:hypothetical protein
VRFNSVGRAVSDLFDISIHLLFLNFEEPYLVHKRMPAFCDWLILEVRLVSDIGMLAPHGKPKSVLSSCVSDRS